MPLHCEHDSVNEYLKSQLREAGEELRANHDDAVIADVIGEVGHREGREFAETERVLRLMVGAE
jgi:hypothetical protein